MKYRKMKQDETTKQGDLWIGNWGLSITMNLGNIFISHLNNKIYVNEFSNFGIGQTIQAPQNGYEVFCKSPQSTKERF